MHWLDGVALAILVAAAGAFALGEAALARTDDLQAIYWLIVGIVGARAAVQLGRPGSA